VSARNKPVYLAAVIGLLITALLLLIAYRQVLHEQENLFLQQTSDIREHALLLVHRGEEIAGTINALFNASESVDPSEFKIVADEQFSHAGYIDALSFMPRIEASGTAIHEQEVRQTGFVTYRVRNRQGPVYFPVRYIEPLNPISATLLGDNLLAHPDYRQAIVTALNSGRAGVGPIESLRNGHNSMMLFLAMHPPLASTASQATGIIAVRFDLTAMMIELNIPAALKLRWKIGSENKALVKNADVNRNGSLFSQLHDLFPLELGATRSQLLIEKQLYWRDISTVGMLLSVAGGLFLTLLLMITARFMVLRDSELRTRNAEIEKQVNEKTASLQKMSFAVASAGESIVIIDNNGAIEYINPAFSGLFGFPEQAIIGSKITRLHSGSTSKEGYDEMWFTLLNGDAWQGRLLIRDSENLDVPVHISIAPMHDGQGAITHFVAIYRDLRKQEAMEEQLRHGQKMESIGTLTGGVAHDFNNMLAAIRANLYIVRHNPADKVKLMTKLNSIETLVDRAATTIGQMLTFARQDRVEMQPVAMNRLIREGSELAASAIPENIDFQLDIPDVELMVEGDTTQLQQLLINLLNNARDALERVHKPRIRCALEPVDVDDAFMALHPQLTSRHLVCLSVSDNGSGIKPELLSQIFDPFFTTKDVGKGTGLGLSMAYGAIDRHHGLILPESSVRKGTTFRIYLPRIDTPAVTIETADDADECPGQGELILLVDDEASLRSTTAEVLTCMGFDVLEAADGEQALALFEQSRDKIRLVITDMVMPKLSGNELALAIRGLDPSMPVIFVTGYDKSQQAGADSNLSNSRIIRKPYDIDAMIRSIQDML